MFCKHKTCLVITRWHVLDHKPCLVITRHASWSQDCLWSQDMSDRPSVRPTVRPTVRPKCSLFKFSNWETWMCSLFSKLMIMEMWTIFSVGNHGGRPTKQHENTKLRNNYRVGNPKSGHPMQHIFSWCSKESGSSSSSRFWIDRKGPTRVLGNVLIRLETRAIAKKILEIVKIWTTPLARYYYRVLKIIINGIRPEADPFWPFMCLGNNNVPHDYRTIELDCFDWIGYVDKLVPHLLGNGAVASTGAYVGS